MFSPELIMVQISDYNVEAALNKFFEQGLKAIDVSGCSPPDR
jgi:hypothetical protein